MVKMIITVNLLNLVFIIFCLIIKSHINAYFLLYDNLFGFRFVVPNRFVNRKPDKALNMYDAYLQMNDFAKRLHRFDPIILVERGNAFRCYDKYGKVL